MGQHWQYSTENNIVSKSVVVCLLLYLGKKDFCHNEAEFRIKIPTADPKAMTHVTTKLSHFLSIEEIDCSYDSDGDNDDSNSDKPLTSLYIFALP